MHYKTNPNAVTEIVSNLEYILEELRDREPSSGHFTDNLCMLYKNNVARLIERKRDGTARDYARLMIEWQHGNYNG